MIGTHNLISQSDSSYGKIFDLLLSLLTFGAGKRRHIFFQPYKRTEIKINMDNIKGLRNRILITILMQI